MKTSELLKNLEDHSTIKPPTQHRLDPVTSIHDVHKMATGDMMEPAALVMGVADDRKHLAAYKSKSDDGKPLEVDDDESICSCDWTRYL